MARGCWGRRGAHQQVIPREATAALLEEEELPGAKEWARHHGVQLEWDPAMLEVRAIFRHHATEELYYLLGRFDGYRVMPPWWNFCDPSWGSPGEKKNYPAPGSSPEGKSSIFHRNPVICAPFNRLAFKSEGGPHQNWGNLENWLKIKQEGVRASTLGDMLAVIDRDLCVSPGRML